MMRKFAKLTSIVLLLATLLGLCSGCMASDTMTVIRVGVPWNEDDPKYQAMQLAVEDSNLYTEEDYVKIELVKYPEDEEGRTKFLKKLNNNEIAMLYYERDELLDPYFKNGRLASLAEIRVKYPSCYEDAKPFVLDTATDSDGMNHMLPITGTYQGLFFNEKIFIENGLQVPKTWEQFMTVINTLKEKGVTPFVGGFADGGLSYWIDELILMEGGVAEHSYIPKFGVVNSWTRAISDIKSFIDMGAFNADCMTATQEDAIAKFEAGEAAMILTASTVLLDDESDVDNIGVFSFPVSTTGKKNIGDIICDYDTGVYLNNNFLKKKELVIDTMVKFVLEYLNEYSEENDDGTVTYLDWNYPAYKEAYTLPANPYTIGVETILQDNENMTPEEQLALIDPTKPEDILETDSLEQRVFNMMENVKKAGRSLTAQFETFDDFTEQVKNYLVNGGDIEALLASATEKEIAAQSGE